MKPQAAKLLILGGTAYLVATESGAAFLVSLGVLPNDGDTRSLLARLSDAAPAKRQEPPPSVAQGFADSAKASGGVLDPFTAVATAAAPFIDIAAKQLPNRDSDLRRNLKSGTQQISRALGLSTDRKERHKKQLNAEQARLLADLESFTKRAQQAMSRADVREWILHTKSVPGGVPSIADPSGMRNEAIIDVYYGQSTSPFPLRVDPRNSQYALAFLAEPIVRATGGFVQRGGRLLGPFPVYRDDEGNPVNTFSDRNPYAPAELTSSSFAARMASPEAQAQRARTFERRYGSSATKPQDSPFGGSTFAGNLNLSSRE